MIKNWNPDHMYEYSINMYVCISLYIFIYTLPVKVSQSGWGRLYVFAKEDSDADQKLNVAWI